MLSRKLIYPMLVLLSILMAGCTAQTPPAISPTPGISPTATLARPTRTPTPPAPILHAESSRTFIYFDSCFDLDEGAGSVGTPPDCDFSIHTDPGGSQETILFFSHSGAKFAFGERLSSRPQPQDCRDSAHLTDSMQAFVPQISYFMCYQTNTGRFGFVKFIDLLDTGIALEWHTYESPGVQIATPTPQPTDPPVFAGADGQSLPPEACFDLDSGEVVAPNDMACDFTFEPLEESASLLLDPAYPAVFLDGNNLPHTPDQGDCRSLELPEENANLEAAPGAVVCFQTETGRYGFLRIFQVNEEGDLLFDWQTFDPPEPLLVKVPTATPDPYPSHAAGVDQLVYFRSCLDLDEGEESGREIPACDFFLYPGPGGSSDRVEFVPSPLSHFGFDTVFAFQPSPQQCIAAAPLMHSVPQTITPLESGYVCYQSNDGRYGFLYFENSEINGVTLDWNTFDPPHALPAAAPTPAAPPENDPALPDGSPVWHESFSTDEDWSFYSDSEASFEISEGKALLTASNPDNQDHFRLSWHKLTDFYLEATFETGERCSSLDHYGLAARSVPQGSGEAGYLFGATCDGHYFLRKWDGAEYILLIPWIPSPALLEGPGQAQRLGFLAEGERLVLFANGQRLAELEDDSYSDGQFGLFIGSVSTPNFSISVDELAYWALY